MSGAAFLWSHGVNCRYQALTLKFRLLSIGFTSARSDDECNGDIAQVDPTTLALVCLSIKCYVASRFCITGPKSPPKPNSSSLLPLLHGTRRKIMEASSIQMPVTTVDSAAVMRLVEISAGYW